MAVEPAADNFGVELGVAGVRVFSKPVGDVDWRLGPAGLYCIFVGSPYGVSFRRFGAP